MDDPAFVEVEYVLGLHDESLRAFGGTPGLRDEGLLRSAIGQPLNDFFYGNADLFGIAAAYAFHIAQAQAFLDGNKRTGVSTALAFLQANGIPTHEETARLHEAMLAIAERRMTKADLAAVFRELFG